MTLLIHTSSRSNIRGQRHCNRCGRDTIKHKYKDLPTLLCWGCFGTRPGDFICQDCGEAVPVTHSHRCRECFLAAGGKLE